MSTETLTYIFDVLDFHENIAEFPSPCDSVGDVRQEEGKWKPSALICFPGILWHMSSNKSASALKQMVELVVSNILVDDTLSKWYGAGQ